MDINYNSSYSEILSEVKELHAVSRGAGGADLQGELWARMHRVADVVLHHIHVPELCSEQVVLTVEDDLLFVRYAEHIRHDVREMMQTVIAVLPEWNIAALEY